MKDIPIIFSGPMVRALMAGRKTMTRRLAWRDAKFGLQDFASEQLEEMELKGWNAVGEGNEGMFRVYKPTSWQNAEVGDRIWVRENFSGPHEWRNVPPAGWGWDTMQRPAIWYWADGNPQDGDWTKPKPSIHMPRYASRLTLTVTGSKMERLQDISDFDAMSEGAEVGYRPLPGTGERAIDPPVECSYIFGFEDIWTRLHGAEAWAANPEVIALTFTVHKQNIDALPKAVAA